MKRTAVLGFAVLALLSGCSQKFGGETSKTEPQNATLKASVFRYPIVTAPTTLDPGKVQDGDTIDILQQVYEGLVKWGPDSKVVPGLAEKWTVSSDGKTYTFSIRKGVKFHNGREVFAEDFKWAMERNTNPKLASEVTEYISDIVGVEDRVAGRASAISGLVVKDPYTLEIHIKEPRVYFPGKLTYLVSAALPKESVPADSEITTVAQSVGAGPFKLTKYDRNLEVDLVANKAYYAGAPALEGIERPIILDASTRLNKFKNGELDLAMLERQDVVGLQDDPVYSNQLHKYPRPAIWYLSFGEQAAPEFKDPRVRQAIAMAIDKSFIVNKVLGGLNPIANVILPPGVPGHREVSPAPTYNVAAAKKLLAEAGFPDGKGFPSMDMAFRQGRPDARLVAESISNQLQQNLGLHFGLAETEWGSFLEKWNKHQLKIFHLRWAADYLDPQNFITTLVASYGPENKVGYKNDQLDALCRRADPMPDTPERLKLYQQAEDIALKEIPIFPIYFQQDFELISPKVSGLRESLFGHLPHTTTKVNH